VYEELYYQELTEVIMKKLFFACFLMLLAQLSPAQLIKDIGRGIKKDAEWRAERKARDAVDKGLDSLESKLKGKKNKKTETKDENKTQPPATTTTVTTTDSEDGIQANEGFVTVKLSTPFTMKGLSVIISGTSVKYEKWKEVVVKIKDPKDNEEEVKVPLTDSGSYKLVWDKLLEEGEYLITATSSDGKSNVSEKLWVNDWEQPKEDDLMDATGKAFERLKSRASRLKGMISKEQEAALNEHLAEVKATVDKLRELMNLIKKATKETAVMLKNGEALPRNVIGHLSKLNDLLRSQANEVERLLAVADHEPYENTICEYIVMLNEACTAFITFTSGWMTPVAFALGNIAFNKGVSDVKEYMGSSGSSSEGGSSPSVDDIKWEGKQAAKAYGLAGKKASELSSSLGQAKFITGLMQFGADVLLRSYCGVLKGEVKHTYSINYKNGNGQPWWKYGYNLQAALFLRYPKTTNAGIIKMKGTLEGNATRFSFMADPAQNPGFKSGTGGKVKVMVLKSLTPFALPVAASMAAGGWGWIARATATPAYFKIPVDAEYNTETGKVRLFLNEASVDFTEFVFNRQVFIMWSAGLPLIKMMDYPISKARLTINAALKDQNEFTMKKNGTGGLSFQHTAKRQIGTESEPTQHLLEISISGKKE
jgi:hypothetical protein